MAPFAALGFVSYHGMTAEQPRRSRFITTVCAVCPDSIEKHSDYLKLGDQYCRFFLKDYASDIKDAMVTDRTNWQRRQNQNNNFSAVVPYDMELQRKESKEFLDDLTTRDQRMMFAVPTMVLTADSKKQLDADTETILSVARKNMCQMAVLKFQQLDGLNTVLPIGVRKSNTFRTLTTESLAVFMPFRVQEIQGRGGIYFMGRISWRQKAGQLCSRLMGPLSGIMSPYPTLTGAEHCTRT